MKHRKTVLAVSVLLYFCACTTIGTLVVSKQTALPVLKEDMFGFFTYPRTEYPIDSFAEAMDSTLAALGDRPTFILFVHGRGDHPNRTYEKKLLDDLERQYDAEVVMFHWPSWEGVRVIPVLNADASAPYLGRTLKALQEYKQTHADKFRGKNCILLVHSMGNLVFQRFMENYRGTLDSTLFDNAILNASMVAMENHAAWVDKIDFVKHIYITSNKDDLILRIASAELHVPLLGLNSELLRQGDSLLSKNAVYFIFDDIGVHHRYYIGEGRNRHLVELFEALFHNPDGQFWHEGLREYVPGRLYQVENK